MSAITVKNSFFDRDDLIQQALKLSQASTTVKSVKNRLVGKGLKTEQAETLTRVFYASMKSDRFHPLFMTLLNEVPADQVKSVKGRLATYARKNTEAQRLIFSKRLLSLVERVQSVPKQQSIFTPARVGFAIAATTLAATAFYYASHPEKAMTDLMASGGTSTLDPLNYCPVDSAPVAMLSDLTRAPFVTNQVYPAFAAAATLAARVALKDSFQQPFQDPQLPRGDTLAVIESSSLTKQDTIVFPPDDSQPSDSNDTYASVFRTILGVGATSLLGAILYFKLKKPEETVDQNSRVSNKRPTANGFLTTTQVVNRSGVHRMRVIHFFQKNEGKFGIKQIENGSYQVRDVEKNWHALNNALHTQSQNRKK